MEKNKLVIELKNIEKKLGKKTILDNINLKFESGIIYGIKGYNGSGKTMLMRLIAGLIFPTKGEILVDGKKLIKAKAFPENIGILIETPAFLNMYSGFENLKILAAIKNLITNDDIKETIKRVGLDPSDSRKYRKYSLGMKQRLGIAAAIMEKPDVLILDEPINALDKDGIEMMKEIIKKEKERGALVLLSCHEQHFLESISDQILTIEAGHIV